MRWWLWFAVKWLWAAALLWILCRGFYLAWYWIGWFVDYLVTHP